MKKLILLLLYCFCRCMEGFLTEVVPQNSLEEIAPNATDFSEGIAKHALPFVVSVQATEKNNSKSGSYKHLCVGSIIDAEFVITAARCFLKRKKFENFSIVGGSNILNTTTKSKRHKVVWIKGRKRYRIPGYDRPRRPKPILRNIALLKVHPPFQLDGQPYDKINYLNDRETKDYSQAYLVGWGKPETKKKKSLELISFLVVNKSLCTNKGIIYTRTDICGYSNGDIRGGCDVDTGGPLLNANRTIQIGLLYKGTSITTKREYVFTDFYFLRSWIGTAIAFMKQPEKYPWLFG